MSKASSSVCKNVDWIILDPLGNIFNATLTVMNLFNFNHFWITQSELCLNGTIVTASFVFVTIFLDTYENPRRKNFIKPSCPKPPQIINLKKK